MHKSASVTLNDNSRDNFYLRLNGQLYESTQPESLNPLALSEAMIDFTPNDRGEKKEITITNVSDKELHLRLVAGAPEYFEVDLPQKVKAGKSEDLEVKLMEKLPKEKFEKSFTIEMDDSAKTRLTIPVTLVDRIPMQVPPKPAVRRQAPPQKKRALPDTTHAATPKGKVGGQ